MILITGGAGFIGSCLHARLHDRGIETVVVDRLGETKWRNLRRHPPGRLVPPEALGGWLASEPPVETVFHLGAISSTTAQDGDAVWNTNVGMSQILWNWCAARGARLVYASSAATYGDGSRGFEDDLAALASLRPMNLYGWSKHAFDLWVARATRAGGQRPTQWAGLKFFNVYGPNEYHKEHMVSVVKAKHDEIARGERPKLFRSVHEGVPDGGQARDFIHVDDVVDVMLWLLDTPAVDGLFNVGTGIARTYQDLARAVATAMGRPGDIDYVEMPVALREQYQSYTCAPMARLRAAGYPGAFTTLEDGIARYVATLARPDPYV